MIYPIKNNFHNNNIKTNSYISFDSIKQKSNESDNMPQVKKTLFQVGLSSLFISICVLLLSKGIQKNIIDNLNKFKEFLDYRFEINSLNQNNKTNKFINFTIRNLNSFIQKSESLNNITSLKDIMFKKLMYKTKPTKKIHEAISNWFEKLSRKTVEKSYNKTKKNFDEMYNKFDKLDKYILDKYGDEIIKFKNIEKQTNEIKEYKVKELIEKAKNCREEVKLALDAFIAIDTQNLRYENIKNATSKLNSKFWDISFKDFTTKSHKFRKNEMWQTFIAEEEVKAEKMKLAKLVDTLRGVITYNSNDKINAINKYLKELSKDISTKDIEAYNQVKKLEWFVKNTENLINNKEKFLKELEKLESHINLTKSFNNPNNIGVTQQTYIDLIKSQVTEDGRGEFQDMLDIYYKIAPFELAESGALTSLKNSVKSFDKSVNLEISELFDKIRDLELGSAPTDVLTILVSSGLITYDLIHSKNKDEKTSIILTSGIPIAGAITTTMITATKLVSGGKSLALGFISGFALNQIGKIADNIRKKSIQE